jgi:hypothetical protein
MGDIVEIVASIIPGFFLAALAALGLGFAFNIGKPLLDLCAEIGRMLNSLQQSSVILHSQGDLSLKPDA